MASRTRSAPRRRGGAPPPRTAPRPPVDERILARRRAVAREAMRRRRRWALSIVALVLLAAGAAAVARSPLFAIREVRVTGVETAAQADLVRTAAGIAPGENLVAVDLGAAAARVEELAWVREAALRRDLPSVVTVEVTPRVPVAVVLVGGGAWLVDGDGVVVGGGAREGLPVIDAPASVLPGVGEEVSDAAISNALAVHTQLPSSLAARAERYDAPSERGLRVLVDGVWVRFGPAERVADKAAVIETLLRQVREQQERAAAEPGTPVPQVAEIDVRAPDNPVLVPGAPQPSDS
ncbi:MAG TPA: FtsQ-type POTRA domain-containing protein [Egibacteraceae bacterium]